VDEYLPSLPEPDTDRLPLERTPEPPSRPVRKRRILLPLGLFALTCCTTYLAVPTEQYDRFDGLRYMLAVMSILLAHEFGHFLQAVRYRIPASLPYFIPMPLMPLGTMGAVIGMEGSRANRKQLFDIGITGPLAGLVVAIPIAWYGIKIAEPYTGPPATLTFHDPLIFRWIAQWIRPDVPDQNFLWNPYYMAGWLGMLITGLNMMPISQLDGGHTAYTLFGRRAHWLARGVAAGAIAFMVWNQQPQWGLMLAMTFVIGLDHPPTSDDTVPLGWPRTILGIAALTIPIFCFMPVPVTVVE